jgi:hypothetical protein
MFSRVHSVLSQSIKRVSSHFSFLQNFYRVNRRRWMQSLHFRVHYLHCDYFASISMTQFITLCSNYCPNSGSASQTSCPAGSACSGGTNIISCSSGYLVDFCNLSCCLLSVHMFSCSYYSTGGAASCTQCPAGSYCPVTNVAPITCTSGYDFIWV